MQAKDATRQKGYYWIRGLDEVEEVAFWNGKEWFLCLAQYPNELNVLSGPIEYDGPLRLTDQHGFI